MHLKPGFASCNLFCSCLHNIAMLCFNLMLWHLVFLPHFSSWCIRQRTCMCDTNQHGFLACLGLEGFFQGSLLCFQKFEESLGWRPQRNGPLGVLSGRLLLFFCTLPWDDQVSRQQQLDEHLTDWACASTTTHAYLRLTNDCVTCLGILTQVVRGKNRGQVYQAVFELYLY